MAKWSFQRSALARKLILITVAFSSILTVSLISIQLVIQYNREYNDLLFSESIIENILIKNLSESIWDYDTKLITLQLRGITNLPYINSTVLLLNDNRQFTTGAPLNEKGQLITFNINHYRNPTTEPLGKLIVEADTELLYSKLKRSAVIIIVGSLVRATITVLILLLMIEYIFGRHLAKIVSYLQDPHREDKLELDPKWGKEDELDTLVSSLNIMNSYIRLAHKNQLDEAQKREQLQQKMSQMDRQISLGEMATSLAHELNQPLATITGYADISQRLANNELSEKQKKISKLPATLEKISSEALRASEIIRRTREFVKGRITHKESFDIIEMLQHAVSLIAHKALQKGVKLTQHYSSETLPWQGDKIQLQQVIVNLLRNALDALKDQPNAHIKLRINSIKPNIIITVSDNGPGIKKDILEQVFSPFISTKEDGMGVGLSISHNIIESHGGRLTARNQSQGACFTISLPNPQSEEL